MSERIWAYASSLSDWVSRRGLIPETTKATAKRYISDISTARLWGTLFSVALVNFYAAAKAASGSATLQIQAGSLGALIKELAGRNPELAELLPTCSYLLNGEACEDLSQLLLESDNIDVLPQFAGG